MPSVIPTVRVPQGAQFVREWGAPRSSYCGGTPAARSSYWGAPPPAATPPAPPLRAPQVVRRGVPRGAHFVRERGAPSVLSSRHVTVVMVGSAWLPHEPGEKRGGDVAAPTPFRFPAGHGCAYSSGFLCSSFRRTQRRSTSTWNRSSSGLQSGFSMCFVFPMCFSHSLTGTFFPFSSGS